MDDHLPLPTQAPFEEPFICARINKQWWPYVVGAVNWWKASLAFTGDTPEEDFFQRQNIYALEKLLAEASEEICNPMLMITDQSIRAGHAASQGSAGGTTTANAWTTLPISHIFENWNSGGSISSNRLYLPTDSMWRITAAHVFRCNAQGIAKIRLNTDQIIKSMVVPIPAGASGICTINTLLYIPEGGYLTWDYYVTQTQTTSGLGQALNISGDIEIYGEIFAHRIILA